MNSRKQASTDDLAKGAAVGDETAGKEPSAMPETLKSPWDFSGSPFGSSPFSGLPAISPPAYDLETFNRIVEESTRAFERYVRESRQIFDAQMEAIKAQMNRTDPNHDKSQ